VTLNLAKVAFALGMTYYVVLVIHYHNAKYAPLSVCMHENSLFEFICDLELGLTDLDLIHDSLSDAGEHLVKEPKSPQRSGGIKNVC